jgi:hypothetical protein
MTAADLEKVAEKVIRYIAQEHGRAAKGIFQKAGNVTLSDGSVAQEITILPPWPQRLKLWLQLKPTTFCWLGFNRGKLICRPSVKEDVAPLKTLLATLQTQFTFTFEVRG